MRGQPQRDSCHSLALGGCTGGAARVVRAQHTVGQGRRRRRVPIFGFKGVEDRTVSHTAAPAGKETRANSC